MLAGVPGGIAVKDQFVTAVAQVPSLAWELRHATGEDRRGQKKKKKKYARVSVHLCKGNIGKMNQELRTLVTCLERVGGSRKRGGRENRGEGRVTFL